jgi:MFS family permease
MEASLKSNNGHITIGLIVGAIGFFVVVFFSLGGSFCGGLFSSIILGAVAGLLTSRYANVEAKESASKLGFISGGIAGVFALFGQIFGGILLPLMAVILGAVGNIPGRDTDFVGDLLFIYLMPSMLKGIIGLVVAGIAGSICASKSFNLWTKREMQNRQP